MIKYPPCINTIRISLVIVFATLTTLVGGDVLAQTAATASTTTTSTEVGWPRQISDAGYVLVYYQPQVDEWKDYKEITGNIAVSLTRKGGQDVHGVATFHANTITDKTARTTYLRDISLTSIRFPTLDADASSPYEAKLIDLFPKGGESISIDRLMADIEEQHKVVANTVELKNDPPPIFYSTTPALLLMVEGDPVLSPVKKTNLQFIVNTNWNLFFEKSSKKYFLYGETNWYEATDLKGPWKATQTLPKDMSKLPADEHFEDVKKAIPAPAPSATAPKIFFSSEPGELLVVNGAPVYTKIANTSLLYVTNTDSDIFLDDATKDFYILISGRWFSSKQLQGPWQYAGNNLPEDFAKIPRSAKKANVLASVPGTIDASDAVMLAQIPTTAIVNKKTAESKVKVSYDGGTPEFKPVTGTTMEYATNTSDKIIKLGDLYYLCFQAIWFMSTSPNGPWKTCDSVPKEIYTIPASSPVYNVTYVTQTSTSDTIVESSAGAGYFGAFIIGVGVGACIAYGTGWYYPPYMWWGPGMLYPIYRPWPCAYGAGFVYNPWTGGFAGGRAIYGPYGMARTTAWYNPATGRYGRSATVQGPYGGRTVASAYNPWTGGYAATSQGHNAYAQWGSSVATRGGQWAQTGHISTANGTIAGYRTSGGQSGVIKHGENGTIAKGSNGTFVGHDGNIYKKNGTGDWSQASKDGWKPVEKPSQGNIGGATKKDLPNNSVMEGLNRSDGARQRGQARTQQFQRGGGGFRGGGGGFRGRR